MEKYLKIVIKTNLNRNYLPAEIGIAKNIPKVIKNSYVQITPKLEIRLASRTHTDAPVINNHGISDHFMISTPVA